VLTTTTHHTSTSTLPLPRPNTNNPRRVVSLCQSGVTLQKRPPFLFLLFACTHWLRLFLANGVPHPPSLEEKKTREHWDWEHFLCLSSTVFFTSFCFLLFPLLLLTVLFPFSLSFFFWFAQRPQKIPLEEDFEKRKKRRIINPAKYGVTDYYYYYPLHISLLVYTHTQH
jgi:hypothetical protein